MAMTIMVVITDDANDAATIDWVQLGPFTVHEYASSGRI